MKVKFFSLVTLLIIGCSGNELTNNISGLQDNVEIIRDQWGVNHIYAKNQHDLFFTQGYAAAEDRLFQFEIWRRQATGTIAEILGPRELNRDIGTRLFMFRGDINEEMNYYHEDGEEIITAYVDGVNAYIDEVLESGDLPVEFQLLDIVPQKWTPEVVISRHQGLLGNIGQELNTGRAVAKIGSEKVKELAWFHPQEPNLELDESITSEMLETDILKLYNAYRRSVRFKAEDIVLQEFRRSQDVLGLLNNDKEDILPEQDLLGIGSNNWVVSGDRSASGFPMMANDPHRTIAVPSLRYMAHLVAPGWNVIGGGEPEIPGISIGHNEYGAWGLTVFRTDGEDLYVYDLNPENLNEYKYQDTWEEMELITERIAVKDQQAVDVDLRYTRHGPVTHIDSINYKAYAVRCAWLEPGGSPYLASLRMDQATTWQEFREACNYSHIPGENMIWADKNGNIGWQAVGIAPIRNNFSGLVPVPGDGRFEWDGYLPIIEKPNDFNPESGFIATANQNVTPADYEHWNAIGFSWSDPYRGMRVNEVLANSDSIDVDDMMALQTDYLSIPARQLVPLLEALSFEDSQLQEASQLLFSWDYILNPESVPAAIYVEWENTIIRQATEKFVPAEVQGNLSIQLTRILGWIEQPGKMFGNEENRDQFLADAFSEAINSLSGRLGDNMANWQYGQPDNKHIHIRHALGRVVNDSLAGVLNTDIYPRGGNAYTPGSTGSNYNQSSGASFRIVVDTRDWDLAMATNSPGQSGDPESPFYDNLFEMWAKDEFFPIYFSREKIIESAVEQRTFVPSNH